jgi:hypothetical protein
MSKHELAQNAESRDLSDALDKLGGGCPAPDRHGHSSVFLVDELPDGSRNI